MATLERKKVVLDYGELKEELTSLGKKAREVLGYVGLSNAGQNPEIERRLVEAFTKLDIHPFLESKVERYKQKTIRKLNREVSRWRWASNDGGIVVFLLTGILAAVFILVAFGLACKHDFQAAKICSEIALPFALVSGAIYYMARGEDRFRFEWKQYPIQHYLSPIPAFALERAIQLKGEVPEAIFYVDALESHRLVKDPFMVIRIGNRSYYIDVWDEDKFEGRRQK